MVECLDCLSDQPMDALKVAWKGEKKDLLTEV